MTNDDIRQVVSYRAYEAGLDYQLRGRVHDLRTAPDGTTIQARVQGSRRAMYGQTILLVSGPKRRLLPSGSCSCPVGFNCKHVAAVLFEYLAQANLAQANLAQTPMPAAVDARLPYDIESWLHSLDAAQQEESEHYPPTVRKRLLYVLERGPQSGGVTVSTQSIEIKRDGTTSQTSTRLQPDQLLRAGQQPKFLRPSDRAILRQLMSSGGAGNEAFIVTLQAIIATGRGRWASWDGPPLTEGPPIAGELDWHLFEDGSQRPELMLPGPLIALRLASPWYIDPATAVMGPVETTLPVRLVQAMLAAPALPSDVAGRVRAEMAQRWPGQSLPAPKQLAPPQILQELLQPHLLLLAGDLPFDPAAITTINRYRSPPSPGSYRVALARLSWRYGPITVASSVPFQQRRVVQHGGALF